MKKPKNQLNHTTLNISKLKNQVIVVTGGAGAIGNSLVRKLLELDVRRIIVIDNLSSGQIEYLPKDQRIKFIHVSIENKEKLNASIPLDTEYIFHLAAHFANQNSVDFPISDTVSNVIGTINLLEISKKLKLKKFINCSSSCVYGNLIEMKEDDPVYPTETPYAINKLAAELYTTYYHEQFDIPTVNLRIFNTYGPYEKAGKYRNVIPNFIDKAILGEDIKITGTGDESRDFTYVEDTVELMLLSALSSSISGEVFNGGTGHDTSIRELAELIIRITGSKSRIILSPRRKWDHVVTRKSNIDKSAEILGYSPKHGIAALEEGLVNTIDWYKKNIHR